MQFSIVVSLLLIIFGIGCVIPAIKLRRRLYLFFAALFLQTGLFFFLNGIYVIRLGFPQAWALLPIFTGSSLLPAGWRRYGTFRTSYIVLSAAFALLGTVMLFFALGLVSFSFAQFAHDWWVLLVLLAGLTRMFIFLDARHAGEIRG
jgi:hypothetical protein